MSCFHVTRLLNLTKKEQCLSQRNKFEDSVVYLMQQAKNGTFRMAVYDISLLNERFVDKSLANNYRGW